MATAETRSKKEAAKKRRKKGENGQFHSYSGTWLLSDKEMANIPELQQPWKPLFFFFRLQSGVGIFCSLYGKVGRLLLLSIVRIEPPLELATPRQNFHFGLWNLKK